ncbi:MULTISPECIES: membrane protein [unclassified Streptomyces]|uniref:membrane protein n=1 Tax=unclassified Streptomyces TaxID=2593676 RepID=UPI0004C1CE74|nr:MULTISPECIES: membrane protein [unclassified Streptomyces]
MTEFRTLARPDVSDVGPALPPPRPGGRFRPGAGRFAGAPAALVLFVAVRLTGALLVLAAARAAGRPHPLALLGRSWDSLWYFGIAAHGYGYVRTGHHAGELFVRSDLAFFPLYPGLVRAVTAVLPVGWGAAGLLVSWASAVVAAYGIHLVGRRLYGEAVATVLVLLWAVLPHSVVLSMAYTEPLLTALAAWSLYAVLSGRWVWAGTLAAAAGLARPNGFAVAAAVMAAAGWEIRQRWHTRTRTAVHRLWTAVVLAPLGWCGYVLWVGHREGDLLGGYFRVQEQWGSRFDLGHGSLEFVRHFMVHATRSVHPLTVVIVVLALLLFALLLADRAPLPLVVYCGVLLLVVVGGSGYFASKPRFLLPAFPLLIPPARALVRTARARPWHAVLVVGALTGLSLAYGAYLVVFARAAL